MQVLSKLPMNLARLLGKASVARGCGIGAQKSIGGLCLRLRRGFIRTRANFVRVGSRRAVL